MHHNLFKHLLQRGGKIFVNLQKWVALAPRLRNQAGSIKCYKPICLRSNTVIAVGQQTIALLEDGAKPDWIAIRRQTHYFVFVKPFVADNSNENLIQHSQGLWNRKFL